MDQSITIHSILETAQYGQNHPKLIKHLQKLQETMSDEEFWEKFIHCVQCLLVIEEKHSSVDSSLNFVSKFAAAVASASAAKITEEEDTDFVGEYKTSASQGFISKFFIYLLQIHEVDNQTIRMHVCQIIGILLQSLDDDEVLDDDLFNDLTEAMLSRLKDKVAVVRAEAVLALSRLQTPDDKECPIVKEYLFHLKSDPCAEVRKNILSCISASIQTLTAVVERVRDVKDSVRKAAFQFLAERVHIKCLTIAQRVQLLEAGLHDRSATVVNIVKTKLIPAWINFSNKSILTLLKYLDVENSQEVSNLVLSSYFQMNKIDDLIKVLDSIQESQVIPAKDLNCENAFYWKALLQHINSQYNTDDYLEKIIPHVQVFCDYIKNYIENAPSDEEADQQLQHQFISEQLIYLISAYDAADGTARQCLLKLIRNLLLLNNLNSTLVAPLIESLAKIFENEESLVIFCMEIIADITEPILPSSSTKNEKEIQEDKMKLAKLQVELNISKDELEQAVKEEEFDKAKELKQKIQELLQEQQDLTACPDATIIQDPEALKNDPIILLKCLVILSNLLQNIKNMNSSLFTLKDSFLLPGIQNADPAVRNESLKSLALFCLLSKEAASQHMPLLIQIAQLDLQAIRILALKGIFDLLLMFGVDVFQPSADEEKNIDAEENEIEDEGKDLQLASRNGDSIISVLVNMLDNNESEVSTVVVEGLCKLLLFHRIMSSKLLSRLMLLWYNPTSDDNLYLRAVLGNFFVAFASASRAHQECLEEAFIPTLSTLWNAPASSPLAEVDAPNVIHFMVELLRPEVVNNKHQVKLELSLHDSLAIKLANEILSNPDSSFVYLLSKALSRLSFTSSNSSTNKDLLSLALQIQQKVTEPANVKQLKKFYESVSKLNGDSLDASMLLNLKSVSLSDATDLEENLSDDLKRRKKLLSFEKSILLEENSNESGIQINVTHVDDTDDNTTDHRVSSEGDLNRRSGSGSAEDFLIESKNKQTTTGKKKTRKSKRSSNTASLGGTGRKVKGGTGRKGKVESFMKTPSNAEFIQTACSSRPRRSQKKIPVYVIDSASDSDLCEEDSKMDDSIMNNSEHNDIASKEPENSEKPPIKSVRKLATIEEKKPVRFSIEEKKPVRVSKRLTFSAKK